VSKITYVEIVPRNFQALKETKQNLKFQVVPPFTFSGSVQSIDLQNSEIAYGSSVGVSGWGATWVSQYIKYCVEQQPEFRQNFGKWTNIHHKFFTR